MSYKYERQHGIKDCGVTCLYNIIKYYNGNISMSKLRKLTKTNENGTNVYNIVNASNSLGLKAEAYKCEFNDLSNVKLPIIAHIKLDNKFDHFVILEKINNEKIIVQDPIRGKVVYDDISFKKEWTGSIITFDKMNNLVKEKQNGAFINLKSYIFLYKKILLFFLVLTILASLFSLLNSFYLSSLYNQKNNYHIVLFLFLLFSVFKIITDYIRNSIVFDFDNNFDSKLTNNIYKKILSLPLKYHHSRPVGDIMSRVNDLSSIKEFINFVSFSLITDFLFVIIIFIIIFFINKLLFLLLIIFALTYMFVYLLFRDKIYSMSLILKEKNSEVNSYLIESILGIDTIKNFNIEKERKLRFKSKYNNLLKLNVKYNKFILSIELFQNFIMTISNVFILFVGIKLVNKGLLLFSNLIIINSLLIYFFISLKNIIYFDRILIDSKNSYNRLEDLLDEEEDNNNKSNFNFNNNIEFKNVAYSYDSYNIFENLSFNIDKGDFVFVKGDSGVGKSTLFKILTKQINDYKGKVVIDNTNIKNLSLNDIRNNICFVSQNEIIFTDTILNNITLFKEVAKKELEKVIGITGIDKFLKEKNISLNFLLEENGHNISGGERQRILLARALLQNKKILILDETTNGIDTLSEENIVRKVKEEYDVTLILISHRYDNLKLFNKVFEIKGGTKCEKAQ